MGRNKLSDADRTEIIFKKPLDLLKNTKKTGDVKEIVSYLETIRSKTLRDLCYFALTYMDDYLFMVRDIPSKVGKDFGCGERKCYDMIKVIAFILSCEGEGFSSGMSDFNQKIESNKTPHANPIPNNEEKGEVK